MHTHLPTVYGCMLWKKKKNSCACGCNVEIFADDKNMAKHLFCAV